MSPWDDQYKLREDQISPGLCSWPFLGLLRKGVLWRGEVSKTSCVVDQHFENVKEVPRIRYFKGWTILNEAFMRTRRWEMSEGLVCNIHWRKVYVGNLM